MHCASLPKPRSSATASTATTSPHGSYQIQSATRSCGAQRSTLSPSSQAWWPATKLTENYSATTTSTATTIQRLENNGDHLRLDASADVHNNNRITADEPEPDTCLRDVSGPLRLQAETKNINMKHMNTLQLIEHLSSRGAPDSVLVTIAEELLTGRTWTNLLADTTATDTLGKFFGVTSIIQQMKLISDAHESIEIDESETNRTDCHILRLRALEERRLREDKQKIDWAMTPCPKMKEKRKLQFETTMRDFYRWGCAVIRWMTTESPRMGEIAKALFKGRSENIDLNTLMRDCNEMEIHMDGLLASCVLHTDDLHDDGRRNEYAEYFDSKISKTTNGNLSGLKMCQVIRMKRDRQTPRSRIHIINTMMELSVVTNVARM